MKTLALAVVMLLWVLDGQAQSVDLTDGLWAVSGIDEANADWAGSTLLFTGQSAVEGESYCELRGFFSWISDSGASGGEIVEGTLESNLNINLQGIELIDPQGTLLGTYFVQLAANGDMLINGNWSGIGGVPSDDWSAERAPDPSALFRDDFEARCQIPLDMPARYNW